MDLPRTLQSVEAARRLDPVADRLAGGISAALGDGRAAGALRGSWLGHPVHPLLVTVPIGAWSSSLVFRVLGRADTSRQLIALGLLAAVPTAVTGAAEIPGLDAPARRVAVVHAAANVTATVLFLRAYRARSSAAATGYTLLGLAAMGVGGALGGHLSYALGAGVHRWQDGPVHR